MKFKIMSLKIEIEWILLVIIFSSLFSRKVYIFFENFYICYTFIIFHEMAHMLVASILRTTSEKLKFCISGVCVFFSDEFYKENQKKLKKIAIYLAGPLSNLLLAYLFRNIKIVYEINVFLAVFNLIPIYPLDGYNILTSLCKPKVKINKKSQKCKEKIIKKVTIFFKILLTLLAIYQLVVFKSATIFIVILYIFLIEKNSIIVKY